MHRVVAAGLEQSCWRAVVELLWGEQPVCRGCEADDLRLRLRTRHKAEVAMSKGTRRTGMITTFKMPF